MKMTACAARTTPHQIIARALREAVERRKT